LFRQDATPQHPTNPPKRLADGTKTPKDDTKLDYQTNMPRKQQRQSGVRAKTTKKREDNTSPVSETASEKAVRDAMLKTTQKIYFPKAFHMPGSKSRKR